MDTIAIMELQYLDTTAIFFNYSNKKKIGLHELDRFLIVGQPL